MNDTKITLSSSEFIPIMNNYFDNGLSVSITVTGNSMLPFLCDKRDTVIISRATGNYKKGDILLFQRSNGKCVLHRVKQINKNGDLYFIGDSQNAVEGPINKENVIGECIGAVRKGKSISKKSFSWLFFSHIWLRIIPIRTIIIRIISFFKH